MSKVGYVIIEDFKRPDKVLVEKFRNVAVASLDDCMNHISAVHEDIRPVSKGRLLGPAFTVRVSSGGNLMFHIAMSLAKPGDVTVIDAGGDTRRSIFGELVVTYCRKRGVAGVAVDDPLRDVDATSQLTDFPIYMRGTTPNGSYRNGPGGINTPIVCGGRLVNLGFIVVGDEDGVIFIDLSDAPELLEKVSKLHENEIRITNTIEKDSTYIRPWVNEKLKGLEIKRMSYVEYQARPVI